MTKEKLESKSSYSRNRLRASLRKKEAIYVYTLCVWEKDIETLNTLNGSIKEEEEEKKAYACACKRVIIIVDEKPI
jgi:hypothetical protein